jgi:hypothetical protein
MQMFSLSTSDMEFLGMDALTLRERKGILARLAGAG